MWVKTYRYLVCIKAPNLSMHHLLEHINILCYLALIRLPLKEKSLILFQTLLGTMFSYAGDKNISILHLSCRMSDLQFSLVPQNMHLSFKSVCNKEQKGVICNMTSSNSTQSTRPVGRVLWEELLVLSRFHS